MSSKAMQPTQAADPTQGQYSDGAPLDEVQYLECKLILKPDRFTSAKVFLEFGDLVARVAKGFGIGFVNHGVTLKPEIREVAFLDTADFRLYNNAFILRRRIPYENGFPLRDPEIVFKFRHPDKQTAAELDVRPKMPGKYRVKFKAEALPLKDQVGGYRLLYSHNVQFPLSQAPDGDRTAMATLAHVFPALAALKPRHRAGRAGEPRDRRGGAARPGHPGLRQGSHRRIQYRHLARARHPPYHVRRICLSSQIQAPGRSHL